MKRWVLMAAVALLLATLVPAALAAKGVAYVNRDSLNVYKEADKTSKVVKTLSGGEKVVIFEELDNWTGIFYVNKKGDDKVGYVQSKYLSDTMPEKYCKHEWTKWEIYREATCTRTGLRIRECTICGTGQSKEIPKLSHEYGKWIVEKEATCTEKGEQYRTCKLCGHRETKAIPKLDHEFGKWYVLEDATCTEKGERMRRCLVCGYREVQEIDKVPHEFGKWTVTKEASCTEKGERMRKCAVCGYKETQSIDKLPHEYGRWTVTREATCTLEGNRTRTCAVCGHRETQSIDKLPHAYQWKVTVQTTDHSAGVRARVCSVCGKVAEEQSFDPEGTLRRGARGDAVREIQQLLADQAYLAAGGVDGIFGGGMERALIQFQMDQGLNPDGVAWPQTIKRLHHDFGPWEVITPLTRSVDGEYARVCKDCGYEERKTVSAGVTFARRERSEEIRTLQRMLNAMGYNAGVADGAYGPKLDAAYQSFALENNLDFTPEQLRPSDVDCLVNGWLESVPMSKWMGRSEKDSPVRLALFITPVTGDEGSEMGDVKTYNWRLSNLGTQRCHFDALLLSFGDNPDFQSGNLVMVVGNMDLQRDGGNNATGTFSVASDWGQGKLNFCAVGTSTTGDQTWLSNVRSFDAPVGTGSKPFIFFTGDEDPNGAI